MPIADTAALSKRCAIYTRRSVEQGPGHQFSSIAAQRSICASYIASQRPNGWTELSKHYDDEGKSGGNLNRPALQDLLSDVEAGVVDVVVIYKLDRISRTLLDFVRLMDLFQQFGVSFVAVTQNFDTADSTGRLVLNVLLTFAQFEREIRDGTQPRTLTCRALMEAKLPMDWALQRRLLGFPDQPDFLRAAPGW